MTIRHYTLGVPIDITVDDDGYITIRADLSDLPLDESVELYEDGSDEPLTYTEDEVALDQCQVDAFGQAHELFIDGHAVAEAV